MRIEVLDFYKDYLYDFKDIDNLVEFSDLLKLGLIYKLEIVHGVFNAGASTTFLGYIKIGDDVSSIIERLFHEDKIPEECLYDIKEIEDDEFFQEKYLYIDEGKYIDMIALTKVKYESL